MILLEIHSWKSEFAPSVKNWKKSCLPKKVSLIQLFFTHFNRYHYVEQIVETVIYEMREYYYEKESFSKSKNNK